MMKDHLGVPLEVGQRVARAYRRANRAFLELRTVARIEGDRLYLNDSHVPIDNYRNLLVIETGRN